MKTVIQRVRFARLFIDNTLHAQIAQGLLALVGFEKDDQPQQNQALIDKLLRYRVFSDHQNKMNLSLSDIKGELMLVSQFTLVANTRNGLRPSFSHGADQQQGQHLFDALVNYAKTKHSETVAGVFGANMQIELLNEGPVTFLF